MADGNTPDRFIRQSGIVPAEALNRASVTVIGVGAIGRQVAIQLVAMGVRRLTIVDFDSVEDQNRTTQGYRAKDIGKAKVHALAEVLAEIDDTCKVTPVFDVYRSIHKSEYLFCCVDSIDTRKTIWENSGKTAFFWADGRMMGENMRILACSSNKDIEYYPRTLFSSETAQQGACTARSTIYTAGIAAGLMIHQFTRALRGIDVDRDMAFNLLTGELDIRDFDAVTEPEPAAS